MPSIHINAPVDQVFEAMCNLTRHAKWATHEITIEAAQEGPPAVGSTYASSHKGKSPDRLTVTDMRPNERFAFHSVMKPDKFELDFTMTVKEQVEGTLVTREGKITKIPPMMLPLKLMFGMITSGPDKKFLNNMKADIEGPAA